MRHLLAALVLAAFAAPAFACLNDVELPSHEREFRSQYRGSEGPPTPPSESSNSWLIYAASGVMLGGAAVLTFKPRRGN